MTSEGSFGSHVCFRKIVPLPAQPANSSATLGQPAVYIALGDTAAGSTSTSVKYSFSYEPDFGASFKDVNKSWTAPQFLELGAERWLGSSATRARADGLHYHYPTLLDVRSPELGMAGGSVESQEDGDSYSLVSYPGPPVRVPGHVTAVQVDGAGCTACNGMYTMAAPPPGFHVSPFFKLDATHVMYRRSDGAWHLANLGVEVWYESSSATGSA
eukprot:SAG31_NODE_9330_length_1296_cov_1.368421_2_plen_213_part_01